jgi:hypothetical protein
VAGHGVFVANCDADKLMTEWQLSYLYSNMTGAFQVKDSKSNNCLAIPGNTQQSIVVAACDSSNIQQLFYAQNGSADYGSHFELESAWIPQSCLGVNQAPTFHEAINLWACPLTRVWKTGSWNFY